jgi:hypothetical protein
MTVIDELLESAESYREEFEKGDLALRRRGGWPSSPAWMRA